MTASERRATLVLALILLSRMLGLFMVLPVLSPWALELAGNPGLAVGLAVGIYGLTQALLQIPLGWLSDRIGRRPVMAGGLLLFICGSVLAAMASSIEALIVARLLQGGGAIAATSTALLADLLRASVRSTGLAIVGISIGGSFLLALLFGPVLMALIGVPGLFVVAALLGVFAMALLLALPTPPPSRRDQAGVGTLAQSVAPLVLAVAFLHAVLAIIFVVVPLHLQGQHPDAAQLQWRVWLPVVAVSVVIVFPLLRMVENRGLIRVALPIAFVSMAAALGLMAGVPDSLFAVVLCAYFGAFNFLEASLPSMLSRMVGPERRGRTMGFFSTAQFFGMFVGGGLGGVLVAQWGFSGTLILAAVATLLPVVVLMRSRLTFVGEENAGAAESGNAAVANSSNA